MFCTKFISFFVLFFSLNITNGYKPVVLLHGILTGVESMRMIEETVQLFHPGTKVYATDKFSGWSSLETAWRQVAEIGEYVQRICDENPDGIILIGYSQGGLIARTILQTLPNHNVKKFISLSSPQAGQYGTEFLHLIFPSLMSKTAYELFYSYIGQRTSVGNYWNDPHQQELYFNYSNFLPYVNNEINSLNSSQFRENLLKLDEMILIGGPDDGVITPWQSSHFGYYNENYSVIPMHERDIYKKDSIGLKTLDNLGKLKLVTLAHVHHHQWHSNFAVIIEVLLPHLD